MLRQERILTHRRCTITCGLPFWERTKLIVVRSEYGTDESSNEGWSCPAFTDTFPLGQPRRCAMAGSGKGRYPPEYRERMVELARAGRSPAALAREFDRSEQTIRNWVRQADLDEGRHSDGLTTDARRELRDLKREIMRLREERDILKRGAAWFARESGSIPNGGMRS